MGLRHRVGLPCRSNNRDDSRRSVPVVVPVEQRRIARVSQVYRNAQPPRSRPILRLCPRIIVFRPFVDQLRKLDVAGSTSVASSLPSAQ
jgi:hypothetical protein